MSQQLELGGIAEEVRFPHRGFVDQFVRQHGIGCKEGTESAGVADAVPAHDPLNGRNDGWIARDCDTQPDLPGDICGEGGADG